jgi:hypothetical protein
MHPQIVIYLHLQTGQVSYSLETAIVFVICGKIRGFPRQSQDLEFHDMLAQLSRRPHLYNLTKKPGLFQIVFGRVKRTGQWRKEVRQWNLAHST